MLRCLFDLWGELLMMLPAGVGAPLGTREPCRTYYEVLEISPTEQDPRVIEEAAVRCAGHVRIYQLTRESECTLRLSEIAEAMITLLDPVRRRQYDLELGLTEAPPEHKPPRTPVRLKPVGCKRLPAPGEFFVVLLISDGDSCDVKLVCQTRAPTPSIASKPVEDSKEMTFDQRVLLPSPPRGEGS
jgi:hypothetical protein